MSAHKRRTKRIARRARAEEREARAYEERQAAADAADFEREWGPALRDAMEEATRSSDWEDTKRYCALFVTAYGGTCGRTDDDLWTIAFNAVRESIGRYRATVKSP